jgi:hypothetical protein
MAFLRQCLQELRVTRRDWAPDEMDWSARARSGSRVQAPALRELHPLPAGGQGPSIGFNAFPYGSLVRGFA